MGCEFIIRPERKEDYRDVENLVRESFWNVYRPGCLEHYVLHELRNDPAFVKETYDDFIKKYPFTKAAFERMGLKQLSDEDIKYYKENYDK